MRSVRKSWLSVSAIPLVFAAQAATAQVTVSSDTNSTTQDSLAEVVVIARKVEERLQDVPISVTAFSGNQLLLQSALKLSDVALLTPGLLINEGLTPGQTVFNIRAQVQTSVNVSTDPSVGVYVDGVYWARSIGANANLLDLQSAQVLRGPQGTLFGRNTTGGAIILQSNDPDFKGASGLVSATYGRFNDRGVTAVLNLPLVDNQVSARFAFTGERRDGYITDSFNGEKLDNENTFTARAKVLFAPTERFSVLIAAEIYENNVLSNPYRAIYVSPPSLANLEAGFEQYGPPGAGGVGQRFGQGTALLSAYTAAAAQSDTISTDVAQSTFARTQTFTGTAKLDTAFGAVKFIGGYRGLDSNGNTDLDGTPYTILIAPNIQKVHQVSAEMQLTGDAFDKKIKYASGLFYFHENGRDDTPLIALPALNPNNPTIYDGLARTDSRGVYSQATWRITDPLAFTGGLRYSSEERGVTIYNRAYDAASGSFPCLLVTAVQPICAASRSDTFSNVSYSAGFDYHFSEDVMAYIKTDKGFRSGGENLKSAGELVAFQPFSPEITVSYEAGLKAEVFERRLRINSDVYWSTTTDLQQQTVVSSPNGTASNVIGNAGKARVRGLETEVSGRVSPALLLAATAAYTNADYLSYIDPNSGADHSNYFFDAPRFTFSASGTYTHDFGVGTLLLRSDFSWTGRRHLAPYNDSSDPFNAEKVAATTAASVGLLNLRAAFTLLQEKLELAAYCRNATDNRGKVVVEQLPEPLGIILAERRQPRMFGVSATYRFGKN
jgi:iron complex outermembrane receptor protein